MTIKAVVFDIGGVLERVQDAWPQTWIARWERTMNLPAGHAMAALAEHAPSGSVVTGEVSEPAMREMYARALGLDDAQADQMMAEMWDGYCGELDVPLRDFAASLRPRYTTAILSNSADGARREEQRRYRFEDLVDVLVYSHEVGLAKPDPAVFRLTERRLGVAPEEIVFLDDHDQHVQAARDCGWNAVRHRDAPDSIAQVQSLLDGPADPRRVERGAGRARVVELVETTDPGGRAGRDHSPGNAAGRANARGGRACRDHGPGATGRANARVVELVEITARARLVEPIETTREAAGRARRDHPP